MYKYERNLLVDIKNIAVTLPDSTITRYRSDSIFGLYTDYINYITMTGCIIKSYLRTDSYYSYINLVEIRNNYIFPDIDSYITIGYCLFISNSNQVCSCDCALQIENFDNTEVIHCRLKGRYKIKSYTNKIFSSDIYGSMLDMEETCYGFFISKDRSVKAIEWEPPKLYSDNNSIFLKTTSPELKVISSILTTYGITINKYTYPIKSKWSNFIKKFNTIDEINIKLSDIKPVYSDVCQITLLLTENSCVNSEKIINISNISPGNNSDAINY